MAAAQRRSSSLRQSLCQPPPSRRPLLGEERPSPRLCRAWWPTFIRLIERLAILLRRFGFLCRNTSLQLPFFFVRVRLRVHAGPPSVPGKRGAENADAADFAFLPGT